VFHPKGYRWMIAQWKWPNNHPQGYRPSYFST
jgi:hypothetical protein